MIIHPLSSAFMAPAVQADPLLRGLRHPATCFACETAFTMLRFPARDGRLAQLTPNDSCGLCKAGHPPLLEAIT